MNHQATTPKGPGSYLFEDSFEDSAFDAPTKSTPEEIRKAAHITNGGEEQFKCPSCKGTGAFYSYTGRYVGPCYKCKGTKVISKGQAAAIKGKETKARNVANWQHEHKDLILALAAISDWNNYAKALMADYTEYGTLQDWKVEKAEKMLAKIAEKKEAKKAEREAAAPLVPTEAIQALFDRAPVKLVKKPIFRTTEVTIKQAPATGTNPGALYVHDTDNHDYLGKIVNGKWTAKWGTKDVTAALQAVAADPTAEAIKYANKFGACCCCGAKLRNPVSVLAVVGPICGPRWGLDHLRMEAAAMLDAEKAAENGNE